MAKFRVHIAFVCIMTLYFLTRWIRPEVEISFVKYYLTDIYFVPAMCTFALIFIRSIKKDATLQIPVAYIFIQVVFISAYFEWYLPNFSTKHVYTADAMDIVMYFIGGVIYMLMQIGEKKVYLQKINPKR